MGASLLRTVFLLCCAAAVLDGPRAAEPVAGPESPAAKAEAGSRSGRRLWRGGNNLTTNDASVKAAFAQAAPQAAAATVRLLAGGKPVALGTVVGADGRLVTKASVLEGELACRLGDGREVEAKVLGVDENYDIALVQIDAAGLAPVAWRDTTAPPGSLVAAVGPGSELLGIGVVSAEPRPVRGSTRPESQRGWLGIALGGGPAGLGITSVVKDSAAEDASLRAGDLVKSIDATPMKSADQIVQTVGGHEPGETIRLIVERDGQELEVEATLGKPEPVRQPQDHWGGGPFSERRWGFPLALPHDVVIHPNDCGGPLIDTDGKAVGINIARALRVTTYAIPASTVQKLIADLPRDAR